MRLFRKNTESGSGTYTMPPEHSEHEGTWLIWPHRHTYGTEYVAELEGIWVQMVKALCTDENVHIIAYGEFEANLITKVLLDAGADLGRVDFSVIRSDDVWVRDTGPIFVLDSEGKPAIAGFRFDGWGRKAPCRRDDRIPEEVSVQKGIPFVSIPRFVLEGGAVDIDGNGTAMASLSSVVSENRNQSLTREQAEEYMTRYLGVRNFIWINGVLEEDITDAHIDGIARFVDGNTILTVSENDFAMLYEDTDEDDYARIAGAKDADGKGYRIVEIPITKKTVGDLGFHGIYVNYYVGNKSVLVPVYNDENDRKAVDIISGLYPGRKVVPIVCSNLLKHGGAIHCVTQQQPLGR